MCRMLGAVDDVRYQSSHHTSDQPLSMVDVAAAFDISTTGSSTSHRRRMTPTDDDGTRDQPSGPELYDLDLVINDDDVDCLSA